MNLSELNKFIGVLEHNGRVETTNKKLSEKEVSVKIKEVVKFLDEGDMTLEERINKMGELKKGITKYFSFFKRVQDFFFGYGIAKVIETFPKTNKEYITKRLCTLIDRIQLYLPLYQAEDAAGKAKIERNAKELKQILEILECEHMTCLFFAKVLDHEKYVFNSFEHGIPRRLAFESVMEDLEAFFYQDGSLTETEKSQIEETIKELQFGKEIEDNRRSGTTDIHKEVLSDLIIKEIKELKEGKSLAIPGGTKSHAVIYKIERDKSGTLSFSIINTGEASVLKSQNGKWKVLDCKYISLTESNFSKTFIAELLGRSPHDMCDVYDKIHKELYNKKQNNKVEERPFRLQRAGTCATYSVLSYVASRLEEKCFRKFFAYIAERDVEYAKIISETEKKYLRLYYGLDEKKFEELWKKAIEQGEKIAVRRKIRAQDFSK